MAFLLSGQGRVLSREVEARAVMEETETNKNIEAYQSIKQLIVNQRLSPGQKLIYRDLEEILGMSKTLIINGLMRLEQEGFVVSKKNRGFFMKEVSAGRPSRYSTCGNAWR